MFRSPLKEDSEPALRMLRESQHQLIMITGGWVGGWVQPPSAWVLPPLPGCSPCFLTITCLRKLSPCWIREATDTWVAHTQHLALPCKLRP